MDFLCYLCGMLSKGGTSAKSLLMEEHKSHITYQSVLTIVKSGNSIPLA